MGKEYIHTDATFSDCGYYRYDLYRQWTDVSRPTCCFVQRLEQRGKRRIQPAARSAG